MENGHHEEELTHQYKTFDYIDSEDKNDNYYSLDDDFNLSIYENELDPSESPIFVNVRTIPILERLKYLEDIEDDNIYILSQLPFFEKINNPMEQNGKNHRLMNATDYNNMDLEASMGDKTLMYSSSGNVSKTKLKITNEEALRFWRSKRHCIIFSKMTLSLLFGNFGLTLLVVLYILLGALLFQSFELKEEQDKHKKYSNLVAGKLNNSKVTILNTHKNITYQITEAMYADFERVLELKSLENRLKLDEFISFFDFTKQALLKTQNDVISQIQEGIFCNYPSNQTCASINSTDLPLNKSEENINKNLTILNNTFIDIYKQVEYLHKNLNDWMESIDVRLSKDLFIDNQRRIKDDKTFYQNLHEKLEIITETVHSATKDGWIHDSIHYRQEKEAGKILWTFGGSILYCITIITTIGYGHITPKTTAGRIGTIIYATFGIPIMVICLAHIGSLMADMFRLIYCLSCSKAIRKFKKYRNSKRRKNSQESENHPESTDNNDRNEVPVSVIKDPHNKDNKDFQYSVTYRILLHIPKANRLLEAAKESRSIEVPVSIVITVFICYNLIGSVFFKFCEGWTFPDSLYFSFITLSTIGFGDLVPVATGGEAEQYKSIMCSFYVLIGLSLCVMSFDLLEKKCRSAVKSSVRKIRLLISRKEQQRSKKKSK